MEKQELKPCPRIAELEEQIEHYQRVGEMATARELAFTQRIAVLREALTLVKQRAEREFPVSIGNQYAWADVGATAIRALKATEEQS